ncbi:MAG: hypothetical protein AAB579_00210 [Patescibacteria group bacterium]
MGLVIRRLLLDALLDIFVTPIWWYTSGLKAVAHWWIYMTRRASASLGVLLWLKNLFVPMFGQRDWQGRLISILMRFVQVIARGIAYVVWMAAVTALLFLWISAPLLLFLGLVFAVTG